jgi:hypothetical protein
MVIPYIHTITDVEDIHIATATRLVISWLLG